MKNLIILSVYFYMCSLAAFNYVHDYQIVIPPDKNAPHMDVAEIIACEPKFEWLSYFNCVYRDSEVKYFSCCNDILAPKADFICSSCNYVVGNEAQAILACCNKAAGDMALSFGFACCNNHSGKNSRACLLSCCNNLSGDYTKAHLLNCCNSLSGDSAEAGPSCCNIIGQNNEVISSCCSVIEDDQTAKAKHPFPYCCSIMAKKKITHCCCASSEELATAYDFARRSLKPIKQTMPN